MCCGGSPWVSLQASVWKVPITVRLTPEQEAAYALGYGLSRADLKPEVKAEYDRLLAERRAGRPGHTPPDLPVPIDAGPVGNIPYPRFRKAAAWILSSLWAVFVVGFIVYVSIGPQIDFQTLRSDLAMVHLPPGYRLLAQHRAGTDCHNQCSITQTWAWALGSRRTKSAACADVFHALISAYSNADSNSPIPARASCDYTAIPDTHHPGQGKPLVEAIVQTGQAHTNSGFLIELTAFYGP